jgi:hypothetical protein
MRISFKFFLPLLLAPACLDGSVQAATIICTNPLTSCGGTVGNVTYSNFMFSPGFVLPGDTITLDGNSDATGAIGYTFSPDRTASTSGSFTYTVTLNPSPLFKYTFDQIAANSDNNLGFSNSNILLTNVNSAGLPAAATYSKMGSSGPAIVPQTFSPNLTSQTFTQSFDFTRVSEGAILMRSVSNSWSTKSSPVPGPLPLLGAATAFGLSRKLRSRIRSAA